MQIFKRYLCPKLGQEVEFSKKVPIFEIRSNKALSFKLLVLLISIYFETKTCFIKNFLVCCICCMLFSTINSECGAT